MSRPERLCGRTGKKKDGDEEVTDPEDWAETYDIIASEYGFTPDQFLNLTARQLQLIMEPLKIRVHNLRAFQANISGHKMEYKNSDMGKAMRMVTRQQKSGKADGINDKMKAEVGKNG